MQAALSVFKSEQAAAGVRASYQELLRLWPVPNEQLNVPTRQGATFVVASGPQDAPPLMLLHGMMANAAAWMREVAILAQERTELPSFTDAQLVGLAMPVLVLLGGRDVTMDSGVIKQRFEQRVPHVEVVLYPDARHYLGDRSPDIAKLVRRVVVHAGGRQATPHGACGLRGTIL